MFKKAMVALAGLFVMLGLAAAPASAAPAESNTLTGTINLYPQVDFGGTPSSTVNPGQGTCIKPGFVIHSADITPGTATLAVDLMSGENCGGKLVDRVTAGDPAQVTVAMSALVINA